jgi:clan AA aspartic protease (TIGR02281 family)
MGGFAHRWFSVGFIFLLMVAGGQTFGQTGRGCSSLYGSDILKRCRQLADAGDTQAMLTLARGYASGFFAEHILTPVPKDLHESIRYYTLAADLGDKEALRHLYNAYRWGTDVSKNQARADQYLNEAAQFGSEWAILLLAQAQEKSAPKKALDAYLKLARNDNCIAQLRLAQAYESGDLVKKNLTQSYFWLLLAGVDAYNRKADVAYSITSGIRDESYSFGQCAHAASSLRVKIKAEETLSKKLVQAVQDAATNWTKGTIEKLLPPPPPPQITADEASPPDTKSKMPPKVDTASPVEESSPKLAAPPPATAPIASVSPAVANSSAQSPNPSSRMAVPLKQDGGIFVVPVEINGAITLEFGVDSGAADVSVPLDVFSTLMRTHTIKDSDIIGEQTYVLADGSKSRSIMFTIRSLKVGGKVVENVKGSVAPSQGTLLLGQSFLKRFKSWSINNTNHELLLEPQ